MTDNEHSADEDRDHIELLLVRCLGGRDATHLRYRARR